ncbi:MAG: TetR family transcriptional regulator [Actinomycetota bacterium]
MADSLRERKREQTKLALQAAAIRLFNERGYGATSVDDIADAANVSRRTFVRYFGSKEGVLFSEADESGERLREALLRQPPDKGPLRAFGDAVIALAEEVGEGDQVLAQQRAMTSTFELRSRAAEISRVWRRRLAEALAARAGRHEATETDLLAAAVGIAVVQTVVEEWVLSDGQEALVARLRRGFEVVAQI